MKFDEIKKFIIDRCAIDIRYIHRSIHIENTKYKNFKKQIKKYNYIEI